MVTIRIWKLVAVGLVVSLLGGELAAADTPLPKSTCPQECQRRAKAAFAFAKLKAEAQKQPTTAPMPKPAAPKAGALCPCGDRCECAAGTCPACPTAAKVPAPAPVAPPATERRVVGYQKVCAGNGTCYYLPIYAP